MVLGRTGDGVGMSVAGVLAPEAVCSVSLQTMECQEPISMAGTWEHPPHAGPTRFSAVPDRTCCPPLPKPIVEFILKWNFKKNFFSAFFKKDFIYLFLERGEGREKERERNINVWLPLTYPPPWGPGPQPRHVP